MTYGQIISILFVALLCYYAFLIVMDIQRAKAAEAAEQDNHVEEDIDISDEAQSFRPHKVSREEPKKEEEKKEDSPSENASESSQQDDASPTQSDADTSQEGKEETEDEQEESDNSEDVYNEIESGIATPSQATESDNEQLLPNLLMMKRPRELLKKNLKNLLTNKHPKKVPMTTNPTAHRPTAKPS